MRRITNLQTNGSTLLFSFLSNLELLQSNDSFPHPFMCETHVRVKARDNNGRGMHHEVR